MFDETVRGSSKDGWGFCNLLRSRGILCGIKLDKGLTVIGGTEQETST